MTRPPSTSLAARLTNVFAAPGEVFDEVKTSAPSTANWLVPALLLVVISLIATWLIFSQEPIQHQLGDITEKALQKQVEKGRMSEQDVERARTVGLIGAKIMAAAASVWVGFVPPFWWGLILWLVGTKALKGNFPYMKAVEVAGLAAMISILDSIVRTLLILVKGNLYASVSPTLLMNDFDPQNTLHSLLTLADVFTFWVLAVRAVGLARLAGVSFAKAAAWVFGIWAAFAGLRLGFSLATKAIFGG